MGDNYSKVSFSDKQIYRLKTYHNLLKQLLEIHFSGTKILVSEEVNRIYLQLCIKIEEILNESIFKKLPRKNWKLFDHLLTYDSDYEIDWDYSGRQKCYDFQSKIEELFIRNGQKTCELESEDKKLLKPIQIFLEKYKTEKQRIQLDEAMSALVPFGKVLEWFSPKKIDTKEKIYDSEKPYDVYKDIKQIMKTATKEVFIIEPYLDVSIYELYIESIPSSVPIKILTKNPPSVFINVGNLLSKQRSLQIRESVKVHDRYLFVDDRCWMIGSSIKDAGKKPTVLVKITGRNELYNIWQSIFENGKKLI